VRVEAGGGINIDIISIRRGAVIFEACVGDVDEGGRRIKIQRPTLFRVALMEDTAVDGEGGIAGGTNTHHTTISTTMQCVYLFEGAVGDGGG
jgi:hypothetical protein